MSDKRFCAPLRGQAFVASRSSQQAVSPLWASILGEWRAASAADRLTIYLLAAWLAFFAGLCVWATFGEYPL